LNDGSPHGRAKARAFADRLGITQGDAEFLASQLLAGVRDTLATGRSDDPWGVRYEVETRILGRNKADASIGATWFVPARGHPRPSLLPVSIHSDTERPTIAPEEKGPQGSPRRTGAGGQAIQAPKLLERVALRSESEAEEAPPVTGTVVEVMDDGVYVEVVGRFGETRDVLAVRTEALRVLPSPVAREREPGAAR